jgi:hypothetical protein
VRSRLQYIAWTSGLLMASAAALSQRAATEPSSAKTVAPAFAAMSYYSDNCAHCHGPQGSFYGPTLGNDLTDDGLIKKCHAMSVGPGNAPIAGDENLVVTAYHRALILRTPYLSITDIRPGQWSGEVTPNAKVILQFPHERIEASVTDWNWTADVPAGANPAEVILQADVNGKETILRLADSSYSSTTPLPPPNQRRK